MKVINTLDCDFITFFPISWRKSSKLNIGEVRNKHPKRKKAFVVARPPPGPLRSFSFIHSFIQSFIESLIQRVTWLTFSGHGV